VAHKIWHTFLYALTSYRYAITSSNIDRFSNLFYYLNQENICDYTITKEPNTTQTTIENKTTSVTTCLFIVLVII